MLKTFYATNRAALLSGLATGVLYGTSYPPFPAWALFFAFAPLWAYWLRAPNFRSACLAGFVAQFVMTLIGFNWVAHTSTEYGHLPLVVSIIVLFGFASFASLNVLIAGGLAYKIQQRKPLSPLWFFMFLAVLSGLCDWLYPTIFPWNTGYPLLYSHFRSSQIAELIGFNLLGLLVYFGNACFALAWVRFPKQSWTRPLLIFIAGLFFAEGAGQSLIERIAPTNKSINAVLVQPNIGNYDKYFAQRGYGYQAPIVKKDFEVVNRGIDEAIKKWNKKPDLVVWPETAYPANLDPAFQNTFYAKTMHDFVTEKQIPMLVGAYSEDPPGTKESKSYNGFFAVLPGAPLMPGYRKNILLAFGEYFPGAEYMPWLKKLVPEISDFGRGTGPVKFQVGETSYVPLICYEGLDTSFVRAGLKNGGDILVNATNDSWFGNDFEPQQHMIMTVARAVEYRRPLIRVTNTGITTVANAQGELILSGPQNVDWAGLVTIPYLSSPPQTFFATIEPFVTVIFLILGLLIFVIGRFFSEKLRTRLV